MWNDWFTIGPLTIHGYGVMTAVGILAAYFLTEYRARKEGLEAERIFGLVLTCVIVGYLGSKLLYMITILPKIMEDPGIILESLANGWVVIGGILGGILGGFLYCRKCRMPAWKYFDLAIPAVALAQCLGRIGCFFAGCCYGVETDGPIAVVFQNSAYAPNGVPLVPTQLICSGLDCMLFLFLLLYHRKWQKKDGEIISWYLILYSIGRIFLEFFRGDANRGYVGVMSTSQFISAFTALAGLVLLILVKKKGADLHGKTQEAEQPQTADAAEKTSE